MNNNLTFTFPPAPEGASKNILKPSRSFKNQVYRSIAAIFLFLFTYIFMFVAALSIATVFGFLGVTAISAMTSFLTLVFGVALIGSGLMLIYFVTKFLFKRVPTDYSGMIAVTEAEQPQLYAFIKQLTIEVGAPFPKRIFISADVNAGVFYDSAFWSMFFPVKKNLKIGLGLVNCVNLSEFKAIMAHEFGHFSQRSMKFGSYVYNVNRVIYNMVYDEGYNRMLNKFSKVHSVFWLLAWLNLKIIQGMQELLKKIYVVVNKTYMGLSRQMEFHADTVAAYVSGSNQGISALRRITAGQQCYSNLIEFWSERLGENKRADNFYPQHLEILKYFADKHNLAIDMTGLPLITDRAVINGSKVIINDQWSSHPSGEDREQNLSNINLTTPDVDLSAWLLFKDPEQLQTKLTDDVYSNAKQDNETLVIGLDGFKKEFDRVVNESKLDKRYKGYYDYRNITEFDIEEAMASSANTPSVNFDELFSPVNCGLPKTIEAMSQDIETLNTLINVRKDIKTFDYKGIKYPAKEAGVIKELIADEHRNAAIQIKDLDRSVFIHFYKTTEKNHDRDILVSGYKTLFDQQTKSLTDYEFYNDIMPVFNKIYNTMKHTEIHEVINTIYKYEKQLKPRIKELIADEHTLPYIDEKQAEVIDKYLSYNWVYYNEPQYDNEAIAVFNAGIGAYMWAISKRNFNLKKNLLSFQGDL